MSDEKPETLFQALDLMNNNKVMIEDIDIALGILDKRISELEKVNKGVDWSATVAAQLKKKIEELEASSASHTEKLDTHRDYHVNYKDVLEDKIEILEKIVQDRKEYDLYLAKGGLIEQMIEQIAELRNLIQGNAISDLNHYEANDREIRELKEEIKRFKEYEEMIQDIHDEDIRKLKVVLRELIKDYKIKHSTSRDVADKLLEKLDVGSTQQMVNKEIKFNDFAPECLKGTLIETEKKEDCKDKLQKCYDEDGNFFAHWCYKCGNYWKASGDLQWVYEQAKLGIYEDCKDDGGFLDEDLYQRIINKLNRIKEEYGIE